MVLKEILEQRDALSTELEGITQAIEAEKRDLTETEEKRSGEILAEIDVLDERVKSETEKAERAQTLARARAAVQTRSDASHTPAVSVENEPMVYGPDAANSWWADQIALRMQSPVDPRYNAAAQRMSEWSHQVEREIANGSKTGKGAEKQFREQYREGGMNAADALREARERGRIAGDGKEVRTGITTGGGATSTASSGGAAFVAPYFIDLNRYAPYREYGRAFIDQCHAEPLPDHGMTVYLPAVTGPAGVAAQTEGAAVTETDPTFGFLSGSLTTEAGEVIVSQQQLDRTGPGFSFDKMIFDQLERDYAPKADKLALTAALANATAQAWTGNSGAFVLSATSGSGGFYGQISKAKAGMRKLAGTVLNPTHLYLDPARWEFISAWADANGRSLVVPDYAGPFNAAGNSADGNAGIEGRTGARFNGLPVFTDANLPTPGTGADQAVVGDLEEVWVFEGAPVHRVLPTPLASTLQVIVQRYSYITALVRYNGAITAISGTGMATISYTT